MMKAIESVSELFWWFVFLAAGFASIVIVML